MSRIALLEKHHKSMKYFLIIIEAFLLSWSPYVAVSFLKILGENDYNYCVHCICQNVVFSQPLLYAIVSGWFQRRIIRAIKVTRPSQVEVMNVYNSK